MERLLLDLRAEAAMQVTFSPQETQLLLHHLAQRIEHLDVELVHTDKRELQRALASDLKALRAVTERIESAARQEAPSARA